MRDAAWWWTFHARPRCSFLAEQSRIASVALAEAHATESRSRRIELDLETRSLLTGDHALSLRVIDDLLSLRIPFQRASQSSGDPSQMASRQSAMVAVWVRDRRASIGNSLKEVRDMIDIGAAVELLDRAIGKWIRGEIIDRLAAQPPSIHEDATFRPFNQDAIVPIVLDRQLNPIRIDGSNRELGRGVVAVILEWLAISELDRMLDEVGMDFDGAGFCLVDRPSRDVDVVSTPVGELAAGVLVPPSKLIVTARPALDFIVGAGQIPILGLGCRTEPEIPVEIGRDLGDG